jgi:hypothetical protein
VKVKGRLAEAINTFEQLAHVGLSPVTYKSLRGYVGLKDLNNWRRDVASREDWLDAVANYGYVVTTLKGGAQGLVLVPEAYIAEADEAATA